MSTQKVSVVDESRRPSFTIVMLAWPVFIEQILVSLVSYVDTAMVGSMGANATAAVSISNSPNMLVNGTIMAIGVGFTAMISPIHRSGGSAAGERFDASGTFWWLWRWGCL